MKKVLLFALLFFCHLSFAQKSKTKTPVKPRITSVSGQSFTTVAGSNVNTVPGTTVSTVTAQNIPVDGDTSEPVIEDTKDRLQVLEKKLKKLSRKSIPGLKEIVDFSMSGVSIQEFLRGLAESNSLNISVDPAINIKMTNNFTNERVMNILLFVCREYDLDIKFTGSIMSIIRYLPVHEVPLPPAPKEIKINYINYSDKISMDLRADSLSKIIRKLITLTKRNVVLSPSVGEKLMTIYIEDMPFESALDKMAFANGLKVHKTKDQIFVLDAIEGATPGNGSGQSQGSRGSSSNSGAQSGSYSIDIVTDSLLGKLISFDANNAPIADVIKAISKEASINYFIFSEPKGTTTTHINKLSYDEVLSFLMQGTEHTFKNEKGIYLIGERTQEGLRKTHVIQLQYRSAEIILEAIPSELKKNVDIKYFKELNSLIMSGSEPRMDEIDAFVKQVDKVVPVINIEVILVSLSRSRTTKLGLSGLLGDSTKKTSGTVFPGVDMTLNSTSINKLWDALGISNVINIGKVTPNFYVTLSALESRGDLNVQSTPRLSTLNGHEANLKIGSTRYYEIQTQNTLGSLTTNTIKTVQYNQVQANLSIKISPIVSGDEQVTMEIDVENSDFTDIPPSGPPPTSTSSFKSSIRVRNEEMIILGGLERLEKRENGSGIPLLSRIPILKYIFSSTTRTRAKSKLLVFIRPTIIY